MFGDQSLTAHARRAAPPTKASLHVAWVSPQQALLCARLWHEFHASKNKDNELHSHCYDIASSAKNCAATPQLDQLSTLHQCSR